MLLRAYRALAEDARKGVFVTPATEWFLDNFHLITSEIVAVRQHVPRRYYGELPALATREQAGDARIYAIAVELLRYSDSRLDLGQLTQFLNSYQRVAPLTLGELWAWPSMLKLALIENLRRLADEIMIGRAARRAADADVARLDAAPDSGSFCDRRPTRTTPSSCSCCIACASSTPGARRCRPRSNRISPRAPPAPRTSSASSISNRPRARPRSPTPSPACGLCTTVDWRLYVESVSLVDNVLRRDPAGVYSQMDFLSRDRMRQAIEEIAEPSGRSADQGRAESGRERAPGVFGALARGVARRLLPDRPRPARARARPGLPAQATPARAPRAASSCHRRPISAASAASPRR